MKHHRGLEKPQRLEYSERVKRFFSFLPVFAGWVFFVSCSAHITGTLAGDSSGRLSVKAGLEPVMRSLMRSLGGISGTGQTEGAAFFDAAAFNKNLEASGLIVFAGLKNTGREKIEGDISFNSIAGLQTREDFIRYEAPSPSRDGKITLHLDRPIANKLLASLSSEAADYLSALMAPVATGENIQTAEYLELVTSIYGKALASEIAASVLLVELNLPGKIQSARGGEFSGRQARFKVPLTDILVLEKPLDYELVFSFR